MKNYVYFMFVHLKSKRLPVEKRQCLSAGSSLSDKWLLTDLPCYDVKSVMEFVSCVCMANTSVLL